MSQHPVGSDQFAEDFVSALEAYLEERDRYARQDPDWSDARELTERREELVRVLSLLTGGVQFLGQMMRMDGDS